MRYRILAVVIFLTAAVSAKAILGTTTPSAEPSDASAAPAQKALPTGNPATPSAPWDISGTIQQMNGEFWEVQGFAIRVTSETRVTGDVPSAGVYVRAQGTVDASGTWLASQVWVGDAAKTSAASHPTTATPSPTSTAAATPTDVPSPTSTVTPSPIATPTARATSVPSPTPKPNKQSGSGVTSPQPTTSPPHSDHGHGNHHKKD